MGATVNVLVRACRICKCTDDDCSGCVERTGAPCWWIEQDLCSACQGVQPAGEISEAELDRVKAAITGILGTQAQWMLVAIRGDVEKAKGAIVGTGEPHRLLPYLEHAAARVRQTQALVELPGLPAGRRN